MNSLPKLTLNIRERDPEWKAIFVEGSRYATNMDSYYKMYDIEVEIVQLNLNSGGMRIRYNWPNKESKKGFDVVSRDVPITEFFNQYEIKEKQ